MPRPLILSGAGRLGTAFAAWLADAGVPVAAVASRTRAHARRGARKAQAASAWGWPDFLRQVAVLPAPVLLLAIPDDALAPVALTLASIRKDWRGAVVLHTSGALPAAILRPLQQRGAAIGSFHPMMTFPARDRPAPSPAGVVFSLQGDAGAIRLMRSWVRRFHGRALLLSPAAKAGFHAAATLLGPGSVVLLAAAERHLRDAGLRGTRLRTARAGLVSLLAATAANLRVAPTAASFTGPWARGDAGTVNRHRREWQRSADRHLHQALVLAAQELLPVKH